MRDPGWIPYPSVMQDVLFARLQMGLSLAFHIVFAAIGIAMPVLMVVAEVLWLRARHPDHLALAKSWAKGTAVLFAVGAVSGTVLSFELGLLFPVFMEQAGPVIGLPFALEGLAFFTEAVFLGIYLYGWNRLSPKLHVLSGILVAVSGLLSAVFVTTANAWMNAPRGFRVEGGRFVDVDPIAAMTTPYATHEIVHMLVAAYCATGFAVAAVHAVFLRRRRDSSFHRKALTIAFAMAAPTALVQPLVGHYSAQEVAVYQPMKLAALEGQYRSEAGAPLRIGGIPDHDARETRHSIEIPGGLSWLAFGDPDARVQGLEEIPRADWPHPIVHVAFQFMVGLGFWMAAVAAWGLLLATRRRSLAQSRAFLTALVVSGPMGFLAIEAGWTVTEVGRQPWVIHGVMRTADSVTPMPGLVVPFVLFMLIYVGLAATVVLVLWRQFRQPTGAGAG
jgi:cytochrome d ubiquinol oxidase subunit I